MKFAFSFDISGLPSRTARILLALALAAGLPLAAQSPTDEVQRGFELIDDYRLMGSDDRPVKASIYSSSATKAILIVPQDISTPRVILWPRSRTVESLHLMKVQTRPGGFAEVKKDPVAGRHDPFSVNGTKVRFQIDDRGFYLEPKPPLVGLFDAAGMLERSAVYSNRSESYQADQEKLEELGGLDSDVRVRVYFGTWCPACGQMVPRILRVAEGVGESSLKFEFYGLPRSFSGDLEAKRDAVKSVPTGIVFVDGKEVGRIAGNDWRKPEQALLELLGT